MNTLKVNETSRLMPTKDATSQKLSVSNTALTLNAGAFKPDTRVIFVSFDTNDIRVTFDGTTPEATVGHLYAAKSSEYWSVERARLAKFIRASSDGIVFATEMTY